MAVNNIKTLRQRAAESKKRLRAMLDKAATEERDLNEVEGADYDKEIKALEATEKSIEREEALLERERRTEPIEDPNEVAHRNCRRQLDKSRASRASATMLIAVRKFEMSKGQARDPRLFAGPAGLDEKMPAEGGFLVQKDFSAELLKRMYSTGQIVSRTRKIPLSGKSNGIKINAIDEDSRADGSRWGGVQGLLGG